MAQPKGDSRRRRGQYEHVRSDLLHRSESRDVDRRRFGIRSRRIGRPYQGACSGLAKLCLVMNMSANVSGTLALTPFREFVGPTSLASCALMRTRSASETTRFWFTSARRKPTRATPVPPVPPSVDDTELSVTVTYCLLVTPVRLTTTVLPTIEELAAAIPSVTVAFAALSGLA